MAQNLEFIRMQGDAGGITRPLWEEIFSEDTEQFLDYYYRYKAPDAWIYLLKESGQVVAMLHLNPYKIYSGGTIKQSYYIVAVATRKEYRHEGCMRRLMREAITDTMEWGCPFVFLMPANPVIYEPFGFRYVYTHQVYMPGNERIREAIQRCVREHIEVRVDTDFGKHLLRCCGRQYRAEATRREWMEQAEYEALARLAGEELAKTYHTFCVHDAKYFLRLQRELQSENGDLVAVYTESADGMVLSGYICYAREGSKENYQEVVLTKMAAELFVPDTKHAAIMALMLQEQGMDKPCYFPEIV